MILSVALVERTHGLRMCLTELVAEQIAETTPDVPIETITSPGSSRASSIAS